MSLFEEFLELLPQEQRDFITTNPEHSGPTAFRALAKVVEDRLAFVARLEHAQLEAAVATSCPHCAAAVKVVPA